MNRRRPPTSVEKRYLCSAEVEAWIDNVVEIHDTTRPATVWADFPFPAPQPQPTANSSPRKRERRSSIHRPEPQQMLRQVLPTPKIRPRCGKEDDLEKKGKAKEEERDPAVRTVKENISSTMLQLLPGVVPLGGLRTLSPLPESVDQQRSRPNFDSEDCLASENDSVWSKVANMDYLMDHHITPQGETGSVPGNREPPLKYEPCDGITRPLTAQAPSRRYLIQIPRNHGRNLTAGVLLDCSIHGSTRT